MTINQLKMYNLSLFGKKNLAPLEHCIIRSTPRSIIMHFITCVLHSTFLCILFHLLLITNSFCFVHDDSILEFTLKYLTRKVRKSSLYLCVLTGVVYSGQLCSRLMESLAEGLWMLFPPDVLGRLDLMTVD